MMLRTAVKTAGTGVLAAAMAFILSWEGMELKAYQDSARIWTICVGHTGDVRPGQAATRAQCQELFKTDAGRALAAVERHLRVDLPNPTRAALTSFVFNVGEGAYSRSTLLRLVNSGRLREACDQLPRWVYADGKRLRGLERRRAAERELCLQGVP